MKLRTALARAAVAAFVAIVLRMGTGAVQAAEPSAELSPVDDGQATEQAVSEGASPAHTDVTDESEDAVGHSDVGDPGDTGDISGGELLASAAEPPQP
jgi:hypothetical protein